MLRRFIMTSRLAFFISILMTLALVSLDIITLVTALSQPVAIKSSTQRLADTDVNPYGANLFLQSEVEAWKRQKTLAMAADAGLGWVKLHFPWEEIEPVRKGDYFDPSSHDSSWAKFDQIVAECERYGLRIVARLDRPPKWSRGDNSIEEAPPDNYGDYGDYVYAFVHHFRGHIQYIQIWNEPNIYPEWGNRAVDPAQYVELLKIAYRRAKEADPTIQVLSAPLAYTLGQAHPEAGKWIAMSDLDYLEAMYAAGAKGYFDILSANAFGFAAPPEATPDPQVLNFQRVVLQRKIMEQNGDQAKAIWFNEFGWNAAPESMPTDKLTWQRVSEQDQAAYTVRAIEFARREWPWAGVFFIWYLRQVGNITPDRADYYFRMVDTDFTPRALYTAIHQVPNKVPAAAAGIYEESDSFLTFSGEWQVVLDAQTSANAYRYTTGPDASISLAFTGSRLELLTRRGPLDGQVAVWVDDKPVSGLSQVDGVGVLNLNAQEANFGWVTLWQAQNGGRHILKLALIEPPAEQSRPSYLVLDAIRVSANQSGLPWLRITALSLAALAAAGASLFFGFRLCKLKSA